MNVCLNCNKDTRNPKFCSRACSVTFNNTNNHWRDKTNRIVKKCLNCDAVCANKYCSIICQRMFEAKVSVNNNTCSSATIKRYLINTIGNVCSVCRITEWNGKPIVMELEHINGDSSDNSLSNCCLICPNCHSQTPTYKGRNKGNGRHYRRMRYQEGKSY
jgi:hypothetical protein